MRERTYRRLTAERMRLSIVLRDADLDSHTYVSAERQLADVLRAMERAQR